MALPVESIPKVNFTISSNGIIITSDYLKNGRLLPFVKPGKKPHRISLYHSIRKDRLTIICDRLQYATFIDFDTTPEIKAFNSKKFSPPIKMALPYGSLPEVNFTVSPGGITITSDCLNGPRFLPFDKPGKDRFIWFDHSIHRGGMTITCDRFKSTQYIYFDENAPKI